MLTTWILVADSSRARIFLATSLKTPLTEIDTLYNPHGREHEQNLTSDVSGRQSAGFSNGNHASNSEPTAKKHKVASFAKEIARMLEEGRNQHRYERLVTVAAPEFLGVLRENLSHETRKLISCTMNKNLTQQSPQQIRQQLPKVLPGTVA